MHVIICAGGPEEEVAERDVLLSFDDATFIGADHGAIYLLDKGIKPAMAVGDFDSLTDEEWQRVVRNVAMIERHAPEKDETDTELAIIRALEMHPQKITVTGATGGRLDHYESNLHLVYRLQKSAPFCSIRLMNKTNELRFVLPGTTRLPYDQRYQYVSFFAFGREVPDVTLRGVAYETHSELVQMGTTRFTSNEVISEDATVSFSEGALLMIRSND
ncbi:thiamine diphosphokinase [Kurthia huakuii]|jgi:thiamine pyrophosphokinase|uniref:thiamine diphosphokinase n=1 Tax=Kurthia huakuii TaxID=1421019 RepID=UPI000497F9CA|nr:thiamine diphosphokinase [Kurthia huakuii]MBM7698373.1 thiamine pyrophosphokinase [Kurthia huakuii]